MPRPVLALPCGSRSMTRTRRPTAASAVARLTAVVVLPTPPFWLAIAMMRARRKTVPGRGRVSMVSRVTGNPIQAEDNSAGVGTARVARHGHCPGSLGDGQFFRDLLAF